MSRLAGVGRPAHAALALIALVTVTSHASLIWHHSVPDFDTDAIINQGIAGEVCGKPWIVKGMGDTAHPLGNALLQRWSCQFHDSSLLTPPQGWYLLLAAAVAATAVLLVVFARMSGGGAVAATIALGFVAASPVMRTLSHRAEEDWIGSTLFLLTTMCLVGYKRTTLRPAPWLVGVALSTVVLAVWHTQYLLVFAFGLIPWGLVALVRPGVVGLTRRRVLVLGAAMAVPTGLVLGALFGSGYAARVSYHRMYFSIFNPDYWHGLWAWCRDYVGYAARWLTGWAGNDGMEEKLFAAPQGAAFVLLGLLALSLLTWLVVQTREPLLIALTFGCLALPFLYEPHNAERWDPTSAIVALTLASGAYLRRGASEREPSEPEPLAEREPASTQRRGSQMSRKVSMFAPSRLRRSARPS